MKLTTVIRNTACIFSFVAWGALIGAGDAPAGTLPSNSGTLVIVHPDRSETMTGVFSGLVIATAGEFGDLDFTVREYDVAPWGRLKVGATDTSAPAIWGVHLIFTDGQRREFYACDSMLRYFEGYPALTLTCTE